MSESPPPSDSSPAPGPSDPPPSPWEQPAGGTEPPAFDHSPAYGHQPGYDPPQYEQSYGHQPGYEAPQHGQQWNQPPYAPQPPYGGYGPPGPGRGPGGGTNVLAILSLVFAFVFSPAGIVLGHLAKRQIRTTGEEGDQLATWGLILGYVFTGLGVLACCAWVALIGVAGVGSTRY